MKSGAAGLEIRRIWTFSVQDGSLLKKASARAAPRRRPDDSHVQADRLRDPPPRAPRAGAGHAHRAGARGPLAGAGAHGVEAREGALEGGARRVAPREERRRSEEHTSELQS